jgi:Pretoxin HINT domain
LLPDDDGARYLDTATGTFISLDPVLETGDTLALNGYSYTSDNPVTQDDPSGMMTPPGGGGGQHGGGGGGTSGCGEGPYAPGTPCGPPANNGKGTAGNSGGGSGSTTSSSGGGCGWAPASWSSCAGDVGHFVTSHAGEIAVGVGVAAFVGCMFIPGLDVVCAVGGDLAMASMGADGVGITAGLSAVGGGSAIGGIGIGTGGVVGTDALLDDVAGDSGASGSIPPTCGGESFSGSTQVVTGTGALLSISQLSTGQKVLATDTATGKNQVESVDAVLVHHDTNLYNLTVQDHDGHSEVIQTTATHLFWNPATHTWVQAAALKVGQQLQTPTGATATVVGGTTPAITSGWMWDLTIDSDHDFYVIAGTTAVLVHNCDTAPSTWTPDENYSPDAVNARSAANKAYYGAPQEVHNTVSAIESGSISQRISGGLPDSYQVRNSTPRGYRWWGGSTVYTGVGGPTTLTRVLVNSDGSVGYLLGHNYNQVFQYPWANLPGAYTGQ